MNDYKLTLMQDEDYEFIYNVKKNAYQNYVEMNWGIWDETLQKELYKKFIDTYKNNLYIINIGNEKVGFYQGETLENGDYEIANICIIPQYQGQGLGTKILKDILEIHKDQNIHIQYFKQNKVGNLYLRLGFIPIKTTEYHYQMIKYANKIIKLNINDYHKCNNIWNMDKKKELKDKFYNELKNGNRITFVYVENNEYLGEVSLVFDMNDLDYTIEYQRIYLSRFLVKPEMRNKGIGKQLLNYIFNYAKNLGYQEMSVGVDLDNYVALSIYQKYGFDKIIFVGEDEQGKYLKLVKKL